MENTWQETTLTRGDLSLILVPSIGGRLMDVVYKGHSLLFTNPDLKGIHADSVTGELNTFPTRAKHVPFPLWGGEKTWLAPERYWQDKGPIPVLDSAAYHVEWLGAHSVKMTSPKNSDGLVITRTVSLSETVEGQFEIHHQITNEGADVVKVGCWSVMMLQRNAIIAYKQNEASKVETYFGEPANNLQTAGRHGVVVCHDDNEFKVGVHPDSSTALAYCPIENTSKGLLLTSFVEALTGAADYAHGNAFEVYNSAAYPYCELEWHGKVRTLAPRDAATLVTTFCLTESDEVAFEMLLS
ncbi:hypothetical protein [Enterovibrio norvegicus]|uniref:DUF4380 domain-containing protein n=1 Tax=Enterovibrio norvegicus TaxID=188144 RepID=A0A2N7L8Y8_9GAMM|nr:hypothetical protein [Enterovibrio norvegicus]PMN90791.1 hypothetical protein BCT23_18915 [Enterovibrio norvegicus]